MLWRCNTFVLMNRSQISWPSLWQRQSSCTFVTRLVWHRMPFLLRGSVDFSEQHWEPFSSENGDTWFGTTVWTQPRVEWSFCWMMISGPVPRYGPSLVLGGTQPWVEWPFFWMVTSDPRSGCGPSPALGKLNLELSDHSVEWWYLVQDQDVEPVQHW